MRSAKPLGPAEKRAARIERVVPKPKRQRDCVLSVHYKKQEGHRGSCAAAEASPAQDRAMPNGHFLSPKTLPGNYLPQVRGWFNLFSDYVLNT
jgi:hypothetical protein